jgi:hypothetical protein
MSFYQNTANQETAPFEHAIWADRAQLTNSPEQYLIRWSWQDKWSRNCR